MVLRINYSDNGTDRIYFTGCFQRTRGHVYKSEATREAKNVT